MEQNATERPVRVGMISLGCAKNLVDAEIMLGSLLRTASRSPTTPPRPTW